MISAASSSATSAVLWAIERDSVNNASTLHAYDATNLANEVYNSNQASGSRDRGGPPIKFAVPTVANGKVFVGAQYELDVYGMLGSSGTRLAAPVFTPAAGSYSRTAGGHASPPRPGPRIHYTLDGSPPTLASPTYMNPIAVTAGGHRAGDRREGRGTDEPRGECQLHDRAAPAPDRVRAGQLRHAADRAGRRQRALHRDAVRRVTSTW